MGQQEAVEHGMASLHDVLLAVAALIDEACSLTGNDLLVGEGPTALIDEACGLTGND